MARLALPGRFLTQAPPPRVCRPGLSMLAPLAAPPTGGAFSFFSPWFRSRWASSPWLRAGLPLALVWLALHLPLLLGVRVVPFDALDEFYPVVYFNVHSIRMGEAPWWNPYVFAGFPQISDPQAMLWSPVLMGWMLLRSEPGVTWFVWGVLLNQLLGGWALQALLQRHGAKPWGALLGAVVWMAGGVAATRISHTPLVLAYCWVPVVLLALHAFLQRPRWWLALAVGAAAGVLAVHLVQVTYLFVPVIAAYACLQLAQNARHYSARQWGKLLAGCVLAVLVALLVALPQLLATLALLLQSNRAELPLSAADVASLSPDVLWTLLLPNALHGLYGSFSGASASGMEAFLYIGAVPALLLLLGFVPLWRVSGQRALLIFLLALLAVSLFYMLGTHTPFYAWLYDWLPGIKQFRRPSDAAYVFNLALALLVGLAASQVDVQRPQVARWLLVAAALWLVLASASMWVPGERWRVESLLAALTAVLALVWQWRALKQGRAWPVVFCLLLVLVVDYRCFNLNGRYNQGSDQASRWRKEPAVAFLQKALQAPPGQLPARMHVQGTTMAWDNMPMVVGLHSTQGYSPIRYQLYDQWAGSRQHVLTPMEPRPFNPGPASAMNALLGLEYWVSTAEAARSAPFPASFQAVYQDARFAIWRNPAALPRVLTPVQAQLADAALTPEQFAATDFRNQLWLTPRDDVDRVLAQRAQQQCSNRLQVSVRRNEPSRMVLDVQGEGAGWVVLSELDFPGWSAQADGAPLPILRANGMFRALCLPAGARQLELRFEPRNMVREVLWDGWGSQRPVLRQVVAPLHEKPKMQGL